MNPSEQPPAQTGDAPTASRRCDSREAIVDALVELLATAGRRVQVFAPMLDAGIWNSPRLLDALRGFATARAQREVQWLVQRVEDLPREQPGLVALTQRLPSLLLLREPDPDASLPDRQGFVVTDAGALLLFDADQRPGAVFTAEKAGRARHLAENFAQGWERGRPLSELRALGP